MLLSVFVRRLKYVFLLIFFVYNKSILCDPSPNQNKYSKAPSASDYADKSLEDETILLEGCHDDMACLIRASEDRQGLDAIRALHKQLDDDDNGAVDLSESHDFLRGELKYDKDAERRQKAFHRNDDMHISVKELWEAWVKSEVHNWTVEQTADWLSSSVELPQYVPLFIIKRVTGAHLPRLASSNGQYITNVLGIKDPIHRQKIMLKAMDVVLFGPPKENASFTKDLILTTLLMLATIGCYYVYRQYRSSKNHLQRMMSDMESLQKAELNYQNLQKELERAKQEQEYVTTEKQNLEKRLKESVDGSDVHNSNYSLEVTQLKEEIELLRNALQRAEGELVDRYYSPPPGLQLWLQLTHEIENKAYSAKKVAAEKQLQAARDACEKLRRKRSSLVGAFVSTHGKSIDDVDRSIVDARTALNEVTQELAERVHRWKQIELLCGFPIINNKGLAYLESVLYKNSINGRNLGFRGRMSSQDNLDDETSSNYSVPTGMSFTDRPVFENFNSWTEGHETSDSDKVEPEDEEDSSRPNVQFIVGASEPDDHSRKNNVQVASNSAIKDKEFHNFPVKNNSKAAKSVVEEHNGVSHESEISKKLGTLGANAEHSASAEHIQKVKRPPRKSELAHSASVSTTSTMDDEACSTDSNSTSAPIDDATAVEPKKKKTKLKMFPRFGRKISKNSSVTHVHSE